VEIQQEADIGNMTVDVPITYEIPQTNDAVPEMPTRRS